MHNAAEKFYKSEYKSKIVYLFKIFGCRKYGKYCKQLKKLPKFLYVVTYHLATWRRAIGQYSNKYLHFQSNRGVAELRDE